MSDTGVQVAQKREPYHRKVFWVLAFFATVTTASAQIKIGDVVTIRESSKNNPAILSSRDATAHAPAPNWIDVDRDALKGRITSLPQRSELVQIQLNEQLIVELYSK